MSEVFRVDNLTKAFGGLTVSRDVSLAMAAGDALALIGPNGAGKTTFVNLVTGHLRPDAGRGPCLRGEDVTRRRRRPARAPGSGSHLPGDAAVFRHDAGGTCDADGAAARGQGRPRFCSRFRGMPDVAGEVEGLLATLGLLDVARRKVGEIAYGQQRLLEIAIALALQAEGAAARRAGRRRAAERNAAHRAGAGRLPPSLAVLMIEHDMDLVFRFAKRVVVLAAGEIIFDGLPSEVAANGKVREAYLGSYADARQHA